jgi:hypothetical protein
MVKQSRVIAVVASMLVLALSAVALAAKGGKTAGKDVVWAADSIKWEDGPLKGSHVAKLWGDWMKGGPYGVLIKFDAGLMNPVHKHTQSLKIVVVSGTFVHQPEGGVETKLGPGSYLMQTGGKNHVSGCAAGAECEFFMTSGDKFDMTMKDAPPAKKK